MALEVADEGPGFAAEFAERAFERFARGDVARTRDGTGLGLVDRAGDRRGARRPRRDRRRAPGATVRIWLPERPGDAASGPSQAGRHSFSIAGRSTEHEEANTDERQVQGRGHRGRGHRGARRRRSGHRRRRPAATTTGATRPISGQALDRASAAALADTGGGKVTETEVGDEEGAYEVEVTRADGSQVDVHLDSDFNVLSPAGDDDSGGEDDGAGDD